MIKYIFFSNLTVASGKYNIKITIGTGTGEPINYNSFNLIKWGEFEFGDDGQQNELLIKASQTEISFRVGEETGINWLDIVLLLMGEDSSIEITTSTDDIFWVGFIDKSSITSDIIKRTITFKCKDGFSKKSNLDDTSINSIIDDIGTPYYIDREDRAISLTKLIKKISNEIHGLTPTLLEKTRLAFTFRASSEDVIFDSNDISPNGGLWHIASYAYNLLHPELYNGDSTKIIKACLSALNSYAVTGPENKLHILPLYSQGISSYIFDIHTDSILDSDIYCNYRIPYIMPHFLNCKIDSSVETIGWLPDPMVTATGEPMNIYFPVICGNANWFGDYLPYNDIGTSGSDLGMSLTLKYIGYPGDELNIYRIYANTCKYYKNGTWSSPSSLFNNAWNELTNINRDKYGVKIKINGVKNSLGNFYNPSDEFTVPMFGTKIFRVRKININLVKNETTLSLLEY